MLKGLMELGSTGGCWGLYQYCRHVADEARPGHVSLAVRPLAEKKGLGL